MATASNQRISVGAGMTAGLEIWRTADGTLLLQDVSPDGRFADDVATWSAGAKASGKKTSSLRPPTQKKSKKTQSNAKQPKQDPTPSHATDTKPRRSRAVRK